MKRIALFFLLIAALPIPSLARLGETETQIEARYGKGVTQPPALGGVAVRKSYLKNSMKINVCYINAKSAREFIQNAYSSYIPLTPSEIETLFNINSLDSKWVMSDQSKNAIFWNLENGVAYASSNGISIEFTSKEFVKTYSDLKAKIRGRRTYQRLFH